MRILLSKKSRKELFEAIKIKNNSKSLKELAKKQKVSFKTLNNWVYGKGYIPESLIHNDYNINLEILDKKDDNWGQVKGGEIGGPEGIKKLKKFIAKNLKTNKDILSENGTRTMLGLWKKYGDNLKNMAVLGKLKRRELESGKLEKSNESFFVNNKLKIDLRGIRFSKRDREKKICFPTEMSVELSEEIGIHLGDGCMSLNRNYFSVKTNKTEEKYVTDFLFPLYKQLYNLDLKLMRLKSVSGFESYSQALCEFKNKALGIPYGEKVERIEVPKLILDTQDKEIYRAFIRGLFDTDGCVCIVKKDYPVISITINSKRLIEKTAEMLRLMGFIPFYNRKTICLNGKIMLEKWIREINSSNPVKREKLKWASSIKDST